MAESESYIRLIQTLFFVLSPFSLLSSFFIIISYSRFRKALRKGNSFVLYLSISDVFFTLKFLVTAVLVNSKVNQFNLDGERSQFDVCFWIGFAGQFTGLATISWNMMISWKLFVSFLSMGKAQGKERTWPYHLFVWGFTSINSFVLVYLNGYGPGSNGCWIMDFTNLRLFFLVPLGTYLISSLAILVFILIRMEKMKRDMFLTSTTHHYKFEQEEHNFRVQLVKYTVVFILFWSFPFTSRILEAFDKTSNVAVILDVISISLQALGNSVVWASSPHFVAFLKKNMPAKSNEDPEKQKLVSPTNS